MHGIECKNMLLSSCPDDYLIEPINEPEIIVKEREGEYDLSQAGGKEEGPMPWKI